MFIECHGFHNVSSNSNRSYNMYGLNTEIVGWYETLVFYFILKLIFMMKNMKSEHHNAGNSFTVFKFWAAGLKALKLFRLVK